jgi:hypothetical protein
MYASQVFTAVHMKSIILRDTMASSLVAAGTTLSFIDTDFIYIFRVNEEVG